MKKGKKIAITVVGVLVVLSVAQMAVLGWYGGMGPMKGLKDIKLSRLAGNADQYDFGSIEERENSPIKGRTICILGSSVAAGSSSFGYAVGEYLAGRYGCNLVKEAVGGTTLTDNGSRSYVQRMLNGLDPSAEYDLFVCQLSTNDASKKKPLGEISDSYALEDFDTATVTGAMEYIICYAKETWGCPVLFFTGSHYESEEYDAMVQTLLQLRDKWDIGAADLWTDETFNNISDEDRTLYMADKVHPTKAGYLLWWGPEIERQLDVFMEW